MKIIIENHIPFIKGLLEPMAEVSYLAADEITAEAARDADILLVRTRTKCNENLLAGSKCKFIGTATIGTDHIDLNYCSKHGITVRNAPGCNAPAVAQYVISSIGNWMKLHGLTDCTALTVGVVGVGHVGSIVARWAKEIGFKVMLNDPPRQKAEGNDGFSSLTEIAKQADIITFHTPLTKDGEYRTWHMCDKNFMTSLQHCGLLINCARGGITDTDALLSALKADASLDTAIDCWENEPRINSNLLERSFIATPHIAGYSAEGKMRATSMMIEEINRNFGWNITPQKVLTPLKGANNVTLRRVMKSYNPLDDTSRLKASPDSFEQQRNGYSLRHEVEN
jgi:erythronate-4-phosphate dehydrogenase